MVAIANSKVYENLYEELDTKEGQQKVFHLAKTRNKSTKTLHMLDRSRMKEGL